MQENETYVIYLRKSRADSEKSSLEEVFAKHESELQSLAERTLGNRIPEDKIFREVVSGETITDRPVISQILKVMESKKIKGVFVVDPQRLTRGDLLDKGHLINVFKYTNTKIITPYKTFDLNNDFDLKLFKMELDKGSDYLEYYKMIQARGRIASVRSGQYIGSTAPYGYDKYSYKENKHTVNTLKPNSDEATVVQLIYHLYVNESLSYAAIANKLNTMNIKPRKSTSWSPYSLKEILHNPVYIGKVRWNRRKTVMKYKNESLLKTRPIALNNSIISDGIHKAIIDETLFDSAQNRSGKSPRNHSSSKLKNPLAGLMFCGNCGRAMSYKTYKNNAGSEKQPPRYLCNNQSNCHTKSVKATDVINQIIGALECYIEDFKVELENDDGNSFNVRSQIISVLNKQLQDLEIREETQYEMLENKIYTPELFKKRRQKLLEEREILLDKLQEAKVQEPVKIDYQEKIISFTDTVEALKNPDIDILQKNMLLKKCIKKITYTTDKEKGNRWRESTFEIDITPLI